MKNGLIIADAGPIFSLAIVDKLELLSKLFDQINIPRAVWEEITRQKNTKFHKKIVDFFHDRVIDIQGFNELTFIMDYGESEAVILYKELEANYLLIDDKKARRIAENYDMKCIGTIGLLSIAKEKGFIENLRPLFQDFLKNKRYYALDILNKILSDNKEKPIHY